MKKTFVLLISMIILGFYSCNSGPETKAGSSASGDYEVPEGSRYEVRSGIIHYKGKTMGMKQDMTMYFDDFGKQEAMEVKIDIMGMKTHNITIRKGDSLYSIDMQKKTGKRLAVKEDDPNNMNFNTLTEEVKKKFNIKEEGTEEFFGKPCKIYSLAYDKGNFKGKFWVWKGITLKTESEIESIKVNMEAEELEIDKEIPKSHFEIPSGVQFN